MKCDKCGSIIDDELNICPVCGNIFSAAAASEEIQSEIGTKIDRILSDGDVKGLDDGVEMLGGKMEAVSKPQTSDTQKFEVSDTVFDPATKDEQIAARKKSARKQKELKDQYHWDSKRDWEDLDDEAMLEKLKKGDAPDKKAAPVRKKTSGGSFTDQEADKTSYKRRKAQTQTAPAKPAPRRKPHVREAKKAPGRSHAGLIFGIILGVLVASAIGVVYFTGVYKNWIFWEHTETETTTEGIDTLTCNVSEGGVYSLPLQITVESSAGNRIYYTIDGSEPNNKSLKYNGPIAINGDYVTWSEAPYTLRVVTYTSTSIKSAELTVNFTVRKPDLAAPVFSLPGGEYDLPQGITISAETGSTIYFTYDEWGTIPTLESNVYRGTIEMLGGTKILSAIAVNGDRISEVAQVTYTLNLAINFSYTDAYYKISSKLTGEGYQVVENEPEEITTPETTEAPTEPTKEGETEKVTQPTEPPTTIPPKVTMAMLYNSGTVDIGGANYYCIWVQLFYENGSKANGMYYGVDSTTGAIVRLTNSGGEFYLQ